MDKPPIYPHHLTLVGTCDLRTLWNPPVFLNQEGHTQRRKTTILFIYLFILWRKSLEKSPMKTYMVKWAFWKFPKKKTKSPHFQEGKKKELWNHHILRRKKTSFEIVEICGGFGHIPNFLLLKRVYEGCVNLNPLTPKEDNGTNRHLKYYI
jgi:hypothetical protein